MPRPLPASRKLLLLLPPLLLLLLLLLLLMLLLLLLLLLRMLLLLLLLLALRTPQRATRSTPRRATRLALHTLQSTTWLALQTQRRRRRWSGSRTRCAGCAGWRTGNCLRRARVQGRWRTCMPSA